MIFQITTDDIAANTYLDEVDARASNLRPFMNVVGSIVRSSVVQNFRVGGRPVRWKTSGRVRGVFHKEIATIAKGTKRKNARKFKGAQTLVQSATLQDSINYKVFNDKVVVGSNVVYAAIHNFGGKTKPHVIKPVFKKALFWLGAAHPVTSVNHPGSLIPKREFLLVQEEDWREIERAGQEMIIGM